MVAQRPPILASVSLVVATFNIRHGRGLDEVVDIGRTARVITRTGAELVALQEVDRNMERSGSIDQPALLAEMTGMRVDFYPTLERGNGAYGIALAATERVASWFIDLPRVGREEPRGIIAARWGGCQIFATHLSRDTAARRLQADALAKLVGASADPAVVLADLNDPPTRLHQLLSAGLRGGPHRLKTLNNPFRWMQIDNILAGPGARILNSWTVKTEASDHRPVVAELELTAPK